MSTELKEHLSSGDTWIRGFFILLFTLFYSVAEVVLGAIVLYQFGSQLITGQVNDKLLYFSRGLTAYIYQLLQFFTYRTDTKPYPFSDWPSEGLEAEASQPAAEAQAMATEEPEPEPAKEEEAGQPDEPGVEAEGEKPESPK